MMELFGFYWCKTVSSFLLCFAPSDPGTISSWSKASRSYNQAPEETRLDTLSLLRYFNLLARFNHWLVQEVRTHLYLPAVRVLLQTTGPQVLTDFCLESWATHMRCCDALRHWHTWLPSTNACRSKCQDWHSPLHRSSTWPCLRWRNSSSLGLSFGWQYS